jgi:hypothetical protein
MRAALPTITLLAWLPLGLLLLGMGVADLLGCEANEGGVQPCLVSGVDIGGLLYALFMMGWLMILALPIMLATVVAWLWIGVSWARRRFF